MKTWTVYRQFHSKSGAVIQNAVRSFTTEKLAKEVAAECQRDTLAVMGADLYLPVAMGKPEKLGFNVGKLFTELGFVSFAHVVGWAEVHETSEVIEVPKVTIQ